jgi:hypothetical protein
MWNICLQKPQTTSEASPGKKSRGLQIVRPQGQGFPSTQVCVCVCVCVCVYKETETERDRERQERDVRHRTIGFSVCPAMFQSSFGLILPCYSPILPFWNRMFTL